MEDFFDLNGSIDGTLEPSLRDIIFKYYNNYFTVEQSNILTTKYIDSLIKQTVDTIAMNGLV